MGVDQGRYRAAMSRLVTGVTVVTTRVDGRHELMTANAVMSVSLNPTLLLISVAESARWLGAVTRCGRFAVNVLGQEQEDLARWCADHARHDQPGHVLGHRAHPSPTGLLLIDDALATVECRVREQFPAGDHRLIVGLVEVVDMTESPAEPLVFFDRAFTTTTRAAAPALQHSAVS